VAATTALLDWAAAKDLKWDMAPLASGERWGARLELSLGAFARRSPLSITGLLAEYPADQVEYGSSQTGSLTSHRAGVILVGWAMPASCR
jgi:hypothetical protein